VCCAAGDTFTPPPPPSAVQCGISIPVPRNIFNVNLRTRQSLFTGGFTTPHPPIVGGQEAEEFSYPWMAALGSFKPDGSVSWFCGGSYIGRNLVLTAAHCIPGPGSSLSLDVVRLGAHDLSLVEENTEDFKVRKVVPHPQYSSQDSFPHHDLAILALDTDREELGISPVCLPPSNLPTPHSPHHHIHPSRVNVVVAGWGATSEGGLAADRLQEVTLQLTDQTSCSSTYRSLTGVEIGPGTLCAGHQGGGRDSCQGDSGGGLLSSRSRLGSPGHVQLGIVSTGIGCGREGIPGIYTRVSHYRQWIDSVLHGERL